MNRNTATPVIKTPPPGPISQRWTQYHMANCAEGIYFHGLVWDRSKPAIGPFCTDPDGNVILDLSSHGAAFPLGYNNKELIETATRAASVNPGRYGAEIVGAWGEDPEVIDIPTPSHLAKKVISKTKQYGLDTLFMSNSGSEAVENAIKLCYDHRRNMGIGFCFQGAFHGRTLGATSLTRSRRAQRAWYPHIGEIIELPFCHCVGECRCGWKVLAVPHKGIQTRFEQYLDADIGTVDPEQVAYIILEPIQGEGGYRLPAPGFLQDVAGVAKKYGIPLVLDEIQSGLGRTGKWFAFEHYDIKPDILCLGKTLRVGATIAPQDMFPKENGRLGGTWSGTNAVSAAVAYKIFEIIERDNLLENATRVGTHLLNGLKSLQEKHSRIKNPRGLGLMVAMSIDGEGMAAKLIEEAFKKGLLVFSCGFDSIRFMPPLDLNVREADLALEILDQALETIS
jgi:4-aminobutyrate aminotransferase